MVLHILFVLLFVLSVKAQINIPGAPVVLVGKPKLATAVCSYMGDPHYTSFDQLHFNYQGICKYNLASYCGSSRSWLGFQIFAKNEYRYGWTTVAWPLYVEIHFGGDTVLLGSTPTVIKVNGVTKSLPYFAGSYKVQYKLGYAVFKAAIAPLKVSFDGIFSVYVEVGRVYASQLCGLCGNFDDDSTNDWRMSNGLTAVGETQFGDSWIVKDSGASADCPRKRKRRDTPLPLQPVDPRIADICKVLGDDNGVLGPLVRNTDDEVKELNIHNCLLDAGYSDGTSVYYSLRHFAVVGNIEQAYCAECQVNITQAMSGFEFGCIGERCPYLT